MSTYDEEIRVAIIATAEGVQAGTDQASAAFAEFDAKITASQRAAAAAYTESQQAFVAAQTQAAEVLAQGQQASVAAIVAAYDELNAARDASLANAQAYLSALSAEQQSALGVEDYATQAAAAALAEQVIAQRAAAEEAYSNAAAQLEEAGAMDANAASTDADTAAELENAAAKGINTGATVGLTEAVGGLARGNLGMAAYGMARMGAASKVLAALMTPAGLAIAGMTAALIGFGIAAVEGSLESARLNDALLVTGDSAGLTLGQLQAMAGQLATGDTTIGEAKDAILALAQSGRFAGRGFQEAAQAVVDFADLTGQSTAQASKYVEALATATTQQLIKANEQYHFLTLAQFRHIELLRQEGKQAQATEAIMDAFYGKMAAREQVAVQQEGYLARAWDGVKSAISGAVNALEQWGAPKTIDQQIAALQAHLAALKASAGSFTSMAGYTAGGDQQITAIEAQIAALERLKAKEEATAKAKAASTTTTDNAISAQYGTGVQRGSAATGSFTMPAESTHSASGEIAQDGRILAALQRDAERRVQIAAQVNSINEGAARSHAQAMLQIHLDQLRTEEAQGQITHAQELSQAQQFYQQTYEAEMMAYQRELAVDAQKPAEKAAIYAQIEALHDKYVAHMIDSSLKAAQAQAEAFKTALAPITAAFDTSINGIIQGTQTMQMAIANILDSILLKYVDLGIKKTINWIATENQMTAVSVASEAYRLALKEASAAKALIIKTMAAAKSIAIDAAEAGAAAFKAVVGIPYVGPILAVAAAATAVMEVQKFASFDVGAWNIPHDMPAMVHAGETILPRPFAEEFRRNGGALGAGAGSVTNHYHINAVDAASFHDMLQRNPEALAAGVGNAMRIGAFA